MPSMHRLSYFRDYIALAICLYQRWIYRAHQARVFDGHDNDVSVDDDNENRRPLMSIFAGGNDETPMKSKKQR